MQLIKLAAAALNQTPLDWDGNRRRILEAIAAAKEQGVALLCLPELCISGYGCEDAFLSPSVWRTSWSVLEEILPATAGMAVSLGLPVFHNYALYNCAPLAVNGRLVGLPAKRFLAGDGIHYEPRWFKPWPAGRTSEMPAGGHAFPIGDLHFDVGGLRIGFEICEDAWVANRTGGELAVLGVDVILNPSASHFAFGKHEVRKRFVLEGSRAFGVSYVYSNLLGNEAGRAIYDGEVLVASCGRLIATGPRFSFADFRLTTAVVDVDETRMTQAKSASFQPEVNAERPDRVSVGFQLPAAPPQPSPTDTADWEQGSNVKEEEFARAEALGLFDYLRKSRSQGYVVSISGGADSAAVSALVALAARLALAELGKDGFAAKLDYLDPPISNYDGRAIVRRLLSCVYQSTRNSSETTLNAARGVAQALGAQFLHFDVDEQVENYVEIVSAALGRKLSWPGDDVALQNIQARARAPGVWMLANVNGALLLSTSNRSEAAVGYATMDGDTAGGLAPIAGIDKAYLRAWLRWMEHNGPAGIGPLPALAAVNVQAPTAELRPAGEHQTDEGDLMPYDLLDAVERAAIRDKRSPLEIWQLMRGQFAQYSAGQLAIWVERFFRLWCRNQWKRERYAPSFHLDDENLDPKTWCRFPILSGGFAREIAELRAAAVAVE